MIQFCPICNSRMTKSTTAAGIIYVCICQHTVAGTAEDSLMSEQRSNTSESDIKYEQLIANSANDPAGYKVSALCECGVDFMTLVRYGEQEKIIYVCTCGRRRTEL